MTLAGFTVTEIGPIEDTGERWLQEFYFDSSISRR
jgi:hypothetical protein